jgi:hypothetical protein
MRDPVESRKGLRPLATSPSVLPEIRQHTGPARGSGDFAKAPGLESDSSKGGIGMRSKRFALYAGDGATKVSQVKAPGEFQVSNPVAMLMA